MSGEHYHKIIAWVKNMRIGPSGHIKNSSLGYILTGIGLCHLEGCWWVNVLQRVDKDVHGGKRLMPANRLQILDSQ